MLNEAIDHRSFVTSAVVFGDQVVGRNSCACLWMDTVRRTYVRTVGQMAGNLEGSDLNSFRKNANRPRLGLLIQDQISSRLE